MFGEGKELFSFSEFFKDFLLVKYKKVADITFKRYFKTLIIQVDTCGKLEQLQKSLTYYNLKKWTNNTITFSSLVIRTYFINIHNDILRKMDFYLLIVNT